MLKIDEQILNIDKVICRHIDASDFSGRGAVSQDILAQLRNFVEHIMLKFYADGGDIEDSYMNICKAVENSKKRGELKVLNRFYDYLEIVASHYTLDEENSERLMLKYYTYLYRIRILLDNSFGMKVLDNLEKFPLHKDPKLEEYYEKIAEKVEALGRERVDKSDKYYVQKIKPVFVNRKVYYEVTLAPATDNTSKFNRMIAFTSIDITDYYAAKFIIWESSISLLGKIMPIFIITGWEIAIRDCEYQNFVSVICGTRKKVNYAEQQGISRCVGKNPKLAEAKSKNDKNISGLLNQVEENKTVVYDFVNVSPYEIYDHFVEVLDITFVSKESTSAMFLAEVLVDISAYEMRKKISGKATYDEEEEKKEQDLDFSYVTKTHPYIEVMYKINGDEVEDFHPTQICHEGKQLITLFFPLSSVEENSENTFTMWLKVEDGFGKIGETQIRATLSGQGLVAGIGDWNGRITVTDSFDDIAINHPGMTVDRFVSRAVATIPKQAKPMFAQTFGRISIAPLQFGYDLLNERVTCVEVVHTFTMDKTYPGEYDPVVIEINDEDAFQMVCDYAYVSSEGEIAYGNLQVLDIDTTPFERVESMEVSICES